MRSGSGGGGRGGRSCNSFCRPRNRPTGWATVTKSTFKRDNATLADFIFDSAESYHANGFKTTTEIISGYIADKYNEGLDIRLVLLRLNKPNLMPPANPIGDSRSVLRIW